MSEKHDRFVILAEKRVNNAIKQLQLIGNLANRNNYEYSDEEVQKIFRTLKEELVLSETQFKNSKKKKSFKL